MTTRGATDNVPVTSVRYEDVSFALSTTVTIVMSCSNSSRPSSTAAGKKPPTLPRRSRMRPETPVSSSSWPSCTTSWHVPWYKSSEPGQCRRYRRRGMSIGRRE
eukprot:3454526-Rhodomonas_salina.5